MTSFDDFLEDMTRDLRLTAKAGSALAVLALVPACNGRSAADTGQDPLQAQGGSFTDIPDSSVGPMTPLEVLPPTLLGCVGEPAPETYPDGGEIGLGFHGRCCGVQRCLDPDSSGECPEAGSEAVARIGPPGSGQCGCDPTQGPYAPNPEMPVTEEYYQGACCYVIHQIGCDGRPFLVEGEVRVAPVVPRGDWSFFS